MKFLKFDLADCPEDAAQFLKTILIEAKRAGFLMPDVDKIKWAELKIGRGNDVYDYIAFVFDELRDRAGLNYSLKVFGTMGMIADEDPKNAKKEKALRRKHHRAWKLD